MAKFDVLDEWQAASRKSDGQTADLIKVSRSKFSRFRNGLQTLPMKDLLRLEEHTGITPAECAEFYARVVKARPDTPRKPLKKSLAEAA